MQIMKTNLLYNKPIKIFALINATVIGVMTIMSLTILPYNNLVGITNPVLGDFFILYQILINTIAYIFSIAITGIALLILIIRFVISIKNKKENCTDKKLTKKEITLSILAHTSPIFTFLIFMLPFIPRYVSNSITRNLISLIILAFLILVPTIIIKNLFFQK